MFATIIVLYRPEIETIATIEEMSARDSKVVVVVNEINSKFSNALSKLGNVDIIYNVKNIGLPAALNQGINCAMSYPDVDYIMMLDQDSKPSRDILYKLKKEIENDRAACIGPKLIDVKGLQKAHVGNSTKPMAIGTLAISGTLMSREVIGRVGLQKDEMFIDYMDHEWCFRAKAAGVKVLQSTSVSMLHNMGDRGFNFMGKFKPIHNNPIRHYYIIRNMIYMFYMDHVPLGWKFVEVLKTFRRIPVYVATSRNKFETVKMILRGIKDGMLKKMGECSCK